MWSRILPLEYVSLTEITQEIYQGGAGYSESGTYDPSTLQGWYPLGSKLAEYPKGTQTTFYRKKPVKMKIKPIFVSIIL